MQGFALRKARGSEILKQVRPQLRAQAVAQIHMRYRSAGWYSTCASIGQEHWIKQVACVLGRVGCDILKHLRTHSDTTFMKLRGQCRLCICVMCSPLGFIAALAHEVLAGPGHTEVVYRGARVPWGVDTGGSWGCLATS